MKATTDHRILNAADFILISAICARPMNTAELARETTMSERTILSRLRRFEELGIIIRRSPDRRWQAAVILRIETPKETVEVVTGKKVKAEFPDPQPEREVPKVLLPPPPPKTYEPPRPSAPVSDLAKRISARMRVPAYAIEYGEVSLGKLGACVKCSTTTPLRYGQDSLCPLCARRGK